MGKITYSKTFREKKCKKCGKIFYAAPEHRYREKSRFYCSWTCFLRRNDWEVPDDDKGRT